MENREYLLPESLSSYVKKVSSHVGCSQREALLSEELVKILDENDELSRFRDEFWIPKVLNKPEADIRKHGDDSIYLCGNSLGLQPKSVRTFVEQELKKWEVYGIEGQFITDEPWVLINEITVPSMAKIVGAKDIEVCLMNSLTVNLHLMMVSFYTPNTKRNRILIEGKAFPSDRMAVISQIQHHGFVPDSCLVEVMPRKGEETLCTEDIIQAIKDNGDSLSLMLMSGVHYYTGQAFKIKEIVKAIRQYAPACRVGLDLAHAAGNIPLRLHDWDVDFACWCTYKYLNSGPGGIGGCFVHEKHSEEADALPRFAGWWGHRKEDRFAMEKEFIPSKGAFGWQLSNPPVLQLAALRASLTIFDTAGFDNIWRKSVVLTRYLEILLEMMLPSNTYKVISPPYERYEERGCQLSLVFTNPVEKIHEYIAAAGVICDLRKPNVMRIAPCPLYNSFRDVKDFVKILRKAIEGHVKKI